MTNPVTISSRSVMMVPAQEYDEFPLSLRNNTYIPTIYSVRRVPTKIPYNCHGQKFRRRCEWKFSLQSTDDGKSIIQLTKPNCGKRKLTKIGFLWRRKKFESTHVAKLGSEQKSLTMRRSIVSARPARQRSTILCHNRPSWFKIFERRQCPEKNQWFCEIICNWKMTTLSMFCCGTTVVETNDQGRSIILTK